MPDITVKVVRETVVERQIPGYTKTEMDGLIARLRAEIAGMPEPVIRPGAVLIGNQPLTIANLIITV